MAQYTIPMLATLSSSVTVEADSLEDAYEAVWNADGYPSSICAQCAGWGQQYSVDQSEWDIDETSYTVDGEYREVKQ